MIVGILIALLVTVIIFVLAKLACQKVVPGEYHRIVWLIAIVLIIVVWWNRVLGPLIGPLP